MNSFKTIPLRHVGRVLLIATLLGLGASCSGEKPGGASAEEAPQASNASSNALSRARMASGEYVSVDGEVTAEVNGAKRTWYVTHKDQDGAIDSRSFWMNSAAQSASISIIAHLTHTTNLLGKGEIRISFIAPNVNEPGEGWTPKLGYYPAGLNSDWTSENDGAAEVNVLGIEQKGDTLKVTGTFSGVIKVAPEKADGLPPHMQTFNIEQGEFHVELPNRK